MLDGTTLPGPQPQPENAGGATGLHPNKLSWLLNEHIGKNFNEFINTYRLEVLAKAVDPANSHLTPAGPWYTEAGFNSKTVFNDFFKKKVGATPRAWVRANK